MNRRWILAALFVAVAVAALYVSGDSEMAARYEKALREAELSVSSKELVLGGIAIAILAYLGWFTFFRRDSD